ncbi:MaoC/PaaZ C-terminal domain-containing protein [Ligilactobacillus sp. Marseille-Q7487]|jgi:3-hydroxybutyryl-CoA dehydratase|uniref:MaoC/PaaZ C-terminal domain-containing protein n=1 Tax=Ligilactobacillus sp. Marseille-Q7487 TaxID=3022128 RepID=UPI0015B4289C|nr:MaoC/PaaZ C-terminal domain-containing protein [Ligilactobacillus sp. Marseille-Q7487]
MSEDAYRQGKTIEQIKEGDSLTVTESISERDLLLYLGLTNDDNPIYIQQSYARQTEYKKPIIPPVLLMGIITSSVSKLFPGPGSEIVNISLNLPKPVFHDEMVTFNFEIIKVDNMKEVVTMSVEGVNRQAERILDAVLMVRPPKPLG